MDLQPHQLRRCVNPGCRVVITGWAGENCHECLEPSEKLTTTDSDTPDS